MTVEAAAAALGLDPEGPEGSAEAGGRWEAEACGRAHVRTNSNVSPFALHFHEPCN